MKTKELLPGDLCHGRRYASGEPRYPSGRVRLFCTSDMRYRDTFTVPDDSMWMVVTTHSRLGSELLEDVALVLSSHGRLGWIFVGLLVRVVL